MQPVWGISSPEPPQDITANALYIIDFQCPEFLRKGVSAVKNIKLVKRILSSFTAIVIAVTFALPLMPMHASADVSNNLRSQNIMLYPDSSDKEKSVSLQGMMPRGASAEALDVTDEHSAIAAYDITIMDGKKEYQPGESNPIRVEIADPVLKKTSNISLWHIKDNGERERIENVAVSGGKLSFYATGFSVYEIVNEDLTAFNPVKDSVTSLDNLTGDRADDGFLLFYGSSKYFTSSLNDNNALIETQNIVDAAVWHFEPSPSGDYYKIYTIIGGNKKYIHTKSGNEIELSDDGDDLTIEPVQNTTDCFNFIKKGTNKYLQHSNSGAGIRYYDGSGVPSNSSMKAYFADTCIMPDDYYKLDGKSYGIMDYKSGAVGYALIADETNNAKLSHLVIRDAESNSRTVFVDESSDITMWTFENVDKDNYRLTAQAGGEKKYLKVSGNDLVLTSSESDASVFRIVPGANNSVTISSSGKYIVYDNTNKKFNLSQTSNTLDLVAKTTINSTDNITYTANRISVSDGENASNGKQLIVYTRIWDEVNKKYDFYAIDHDGSLKPCYASGDKLMWLDDATNSLLWELTVYEDEDGKETGYYELRNTYSGKYLAPQLKGGQILSDKKIGIQMPGRKYEVTEQGGEKLYDIGEYYSSIIAWDKSYYDYAALHGVADSTARSGNITAAPFASGDSFYFATLDEIISDESTDGLHSVKTLNNEDYGITMKFKDFNKSSSSNNSEITQNYFGGNIEDKKGLLSDSLNEDGHPTVNYSNNASQKGKDFGAEFDNGAMLVDNLFINSIYQSSGYFQFDSCQNFATLLGGENGGYKTHKNDDGETVYDFTVYSELGTHDAEPKTTLKHGQFFPLNTITPGKYSKHNPENIYGFDADYRDPTKGLLADDDPRKYEKLHLIENPNYYLGMEMKADFVQTPNGLDAWGHDVIFEFTGDDDFWLYVDGELVIDLGGIHSALSGKVNFRTGEVNYQGADPTTLYDIFYNHYKNTLGEQQAAAKVDDVFHKKIVDGKECYVFKDYTEHSMKVYYMERGKGASNLHMKFNLSSVTPGHVLFAKGLAGKDEDLNDMDYNLIQYPFQIFYKVTEDGPETVLTKDDANGIGAKYQNSTQTVRYEPTYTSPEGYSFNNVFFINPNKNVEISFPDEAMYYRIVECAVNTNIYGSATINDREAEAYEVQGALKNLSTGYEQVALRPSVDFVNNVNEGNIRTLSITKKLYNENGKDEGNELSYESENASKQDKTTFNFRLYLSNGTDSAVKLADLCRYYICDPDGHLCYWNADEQKFEIFTIDGTPITEITTNTPRALTEAEKNKLTNHTSRFGAISNVPAGYTVKVPGLPAGTRFYVEERDYETPVGYELIDYDCVTAKKGDVEESTYVVDHTYILDGETHNVEHTNSAGTIRAGYDPAMIINNRRGFGLKVNKQWSDSSFTKSHGNVFVAVYVDGELLDGSVKAITSGKGSASYFFTQLQSGKALSDYEIHEVKLTDAVVDEHGNVTSYSAIEDVVALNSTVDISATDTKGVSSQQSYKPIYTKGQEKASSGQQGGTPNARTDTIRNIRRGGINIDLHRWNNTDSEDTPLSDGEFVITCDGKAIGTYTTDESGNVTTLYGLETGKEYVITQTVSPTGFTGLTDPVKFVISENEGVYSITTWTNHNDTDDDTQRSDGKYWAEYTNAPGNGIAAQIDIYNKPFTLKAIKVDDLTGEPINNAVFTLNRSYIAFGSRIKDRDPVSTYDALRTGENVDAGVIPKIDNTIPAGTYYLCEKQPASNYSNIDKDILFTISENGVVSVDDEFSSMFAYTKGESEDSYLLTIPNTKLKSNVDLTIHKTVDGNMGNKRKEFTFTLTVDGSDEADSYDWTLNGEDQQPLTSGGTFTMKHDDTVVISVPSGVEITIAENSENYTSQFSLDDEALQQADSKTFTLDSDAKLEVRNTLNSAIPTGVKLSAQMVFTALICIIAGWALYYKKGRKERED